MLRPSTVPILSVLARLHAGVFTTTGVTTNENRRPVADRVRGRHAAADADGVGARLRSVRCHIIAAANLCGGLQMEHLMSTESGAR